ncbi:unnamed protein product [Closterium sp. NIES-64]|nr:unnamed protein product [Closterium sp. NIES-64]
MQVRGRCRCGGDAGAGEMQVRGRCRCGGDAGAGEMQVRGRCRCGGDAGAGEMQVQGRCRCGGDAGAGEMQAVAAHRGMTVRVSALPLVGMGAPYHRHGIPTIGPAKTMPSGGFIYMDGKQLANDVAAGLLDLTLQQVCTVLPLVTTPHCFPPHRIQPLQWQAMKRWVEAQSSTTGAIVAVGDVFPLALACLASHHATTLPATAAPSTAPAASRPAALPFAFMGTAKSEFYIRADHARLLPSQATTFGSELDIDVPPSLPLSPPSSPPSSLTPPPSLTPLSLCILTPLSLCILTPLSLCILTPLSLCILTPLSLCILTPLSLCILTPLSLCILTPLSLCILTPLSLCILTPLSLCILTPLSLCILTPLSLCILTPLSLCILTPLSLCILTPLSLCILTPLSLCILTPLSLGGGTEGECTTRGSDGSWRMHAAARLTVQVGNQDASYGRPSVFLHHPPTPSPTVRLSPARLAAVRDRLTAQVLAQNMLLEEASPSASSSSSPGTVQDGSEAGLFRRGKVAYLGNPMMDHMAPSPHLHTFIRTHLRAWLHHRTTRDAHSEGGAHTTAPNGAPPGDAACQSSSSSSSPFRHVFAILPGSRPPEVAGKLCVDAIFCQPWTLFYLHECPSATSSMSICWLPLSPSRPTSEGAGGGAEAGWVELDGEGLLQGLVLILPEREEEEEAHGNSRAWRGENRAVVALGGAQEEGKGGGSIAAGGSSGGAASSGVGSTGGVRAVVVVVRGGFAECAHEAHGALAMAGTATEQMVGLGKPVFIIPGKGPQFTAVFAEAQTRLLGKSVILSSSPEELGAAAAATMADAALLQEIAANGRIRMGGPGGARRIATAVLDALLW